MSPLASAFVGFCVGASVTVWVASAVVRMLRERIAALNAELATARSEASDARQAHLLTRATLGAENAILRGALKAVREEERGWR